MVPSLRYSGTQVPKPYFFRVFQDISRTFPGHFQHFSSRIQFHSMPYSANSHTQKLPISQVNGPFYWRYRFHIFLAYFSGREYPHNSYGQHYGTFTYLHVLDPEIEIPIEPGHIHVRECFYCHNTIDRHELHYSCPDCGCAVAGCIREMPSGLKHDTLGIP